MTRRSPWVRALLTMTVALCTLATLLSTSSDTGPEVSTAADISQFDPGNIISDAMFFDPNALTPQQVADFIAAKGSACKVGADGSPCLKHFTQSTFSRAADGICDNAYAGAPGESAAMIIWKVGRACNISQKVLLVLLQKEQALVTTTNPTARRYEIAAGMGCPDTAACDTQYYGFYNQVYAAARQYQRYATYPKNYFYRAGVTNTIQWSPNGACGSSQVYIANQATAGLYVYTPYRPNSAALRAGYGTGDGCSAYGNRNFWLYFTDWFGSTRSPGGDAILAAYAARGGASGPLGPATSGVICGLAAGGCRQTFQNGNLYWSSATGVRAVAEPYLTAWGWLREGGALGYPINDGACGMWAGGCGQAFQHGRIYSTWSTGTHAIWGPIQDAWIAQGWENGPLRYPTGEQVCGLVKGGCSQPFLGGRIYHSSGSGAHAVSGAILDAWIAQGVEAGWLGYPTSGLICGMRDTGCGQVFQGGRIFQSASTGAHAVTGAIQAAWAASGWEAGRLGYPTGDQVCGLHVGGCKQPFQGGTMYSTWGTGTHAVSGAIATAWTAAGGESGTLGYPTGGQVCGLYVGGCKQPFQGGTMYSTWGTGTHPVSGAIATAWTATGAESGTLGYPTGRPVCGLKSSGCGQAFQHGLMYTATGAGTHFLTGRIRDAWVAQGYEVGSLGYATSDPYAVAGGTAQDFQGGKLTYDSTTDRVIRS